MITAVHTAPAFPPIPLADWVHTKETLHRFPQIVGKIRLDQAPWRNHWWHVPFHVTGRGITTRPMGEDPIFAVDFDFVDHRLLVRRATGHTVSFPLAEQSVAAFHDRTFAALAASGISATIRADPFDLPDATPFAEDIAHASYNPFSVNRYWQVLAQVSLVLEEFAGRSYAKTSPVHHFWHTFDLAVTRFSDKAVDLPLTVDTVTRKAYSHEVISFGFWFGDDTVSAPTFYSYTAPEPAELPAQRLRPERACWLPSRGSHIAVLDHDDARAAPDTRATILDFFESAYEAGARLAGWDAERLRCPDAFSW